jgi:peptidoglycan/LPS O-acetylase OafA/YrhL
MNAAFFSPRPRTASSAAKESAVSNGQHARRIHRWVATIFTLTVAANFAAMPWGQPPAWITYAPLPPLLFLTSTGLTMLVSSWIGQAREKRALRKGTVQ